MKRLFFVLIFLPVLLVLIFLLTQMRWKWSKPARPTGKLPETTSSNTIALTSSANSVTPAGRPNELLGETILRGYGDTNLPPENDLALMSRLMDNSLLLLKAAANRPLSANEDWADLFRGKNGAQEEFLPTRHVALNGQGQLIDRWQSPLFFHALGGGRYEIRSAGPDQKLWTADDLQRNANGTFLRATNGASQPPR